ncbi:MAG: hypothetical protein AAGA86_00405, partial [Bacteroidota bacterium]
TYTAGTGLDLTGTAFSVDDSDINPEWGNITGVPANLDTDSTDDFSGSFDDLTDVPAGLADGDDDTTYTAGTGLDLTGTAFSVDDSDINPEWGNITGVPANLDTDSTDDFSGSFDDLTDVPANLDTDSTDDFSGSFDDLTDVPAGLADGDDDTTTNLSQNTTTGVITYTNEENTDQTANTVGAETDNSITVGANGGAFYESPIKAFGKIGAGGGVIRGTTGVTASLLSTGYYRIALPSGAVSDGDYIIQLTQPGRGGAGNDDPGISYNNQTAAGFDVIIGDNDNGGTDRARFNSEFMFTVLDL